MQAEPIHLAIAFDQNYITPFYVLTTSIFHNSTGCFHLHTIATGLRDEEKEEIRCFVQQYHSTISFYELDPTLIEGLVIPNGLYFTVAAYY